MPSPPPGLRLRDRAPGSALIPLQPNRDQSLVHHIRTRTCPRERSTHSSTLSTNGSINRTRRHGARHRQPPIPPLHMVTSPSWDHTRPTPRPSARTRSSRTPQESPSLPCLLLIRHSTSLGSNDNPESTAGGTTHDGPTRRQPGQPQGDQLSAAREMRCPPTERMACPLSSVLLVAVKTAVT